MPGFYRPTSKKFDFIILNLFLTFMLSYLQQLDASLLVAINGWHCPFADQLMWLISGKFSSALILIAVLALPLRKGNWKNALTLLIAIALVVIIADRVSSGIIKPLVERLRPTHNPDLQALVHVVNDYRGGKYGFVSSHAANMFGIATFVALVVRNRYTWLCLLSWAAIVSYSRIYLGVHYPGDILGGMLVGIGATWLVAWLWKKAQNRSHIPAIHTIYHRSDAVWINHAVATNFLLIMAFAAAQTTF
ncbi:MAG: phosphatase PAP2 family protein [Sodaliphilus sp.]